MTMYPLFNTGKLKSLNATAKMDDARRYAIDNGLRFYNTGKPCKYGHMADRYTLTHNCVECHHLYKLKHGRRYQLKFKYKSSEAEYAQMLESQKGLCKICGQPETSLDGTTKKTKLLSLDHCHDTGKIRGLLCTNCNLGIGKFKHSPELLRAAALYCEETK